MEQESVLKPQLILWSWIFFLVALYFWKKYENRNSLSKFITIELLIISIYLLNTKFLFDSIYEFVPEELLINSFTIFIDSYFPFFIILIEIIYHFIEILIAIIIYKIIRRNDLKSNLILIHLIILCISGLNYLMEQKIWELEFEDEEELQPAPKPASKEKGNVNKNKSESEGSGSIWDFIFEVILGILEALL